jgi:hypothetical protein
MKTYLSVCFFLSFPIAIITCFKVFYGLKQKDKFVLLHMIHTIMLIISTIFVCIYIHKLFVYSEVSCEVKKTNNFVSKFEHHHKFHFSNDFKFDIDAEIRKNDISMVPITFNNSHVLAYAYLKGSCNWNRLMAGYKYPELYPINEKIRKMAPTKLPVIFFGEYPDTWPFTFIFISHISWNDFNVFFHFNVYRQRIA